MELCPDILLEDPARYQGRWLESINDKKELWLELGCGKGRFTAETAALNPDCLVVAIEKVPDVLVIAMERVCSAALENVRFIGYDALALPVIFAENEVDRVFINFCDPWPRPRDAKRRLTSPGYLQIYENILKPGGKLFFKTDNIPLFEYSVRSFLSEGWGISEVTRDLHGIGCDGVMTDYEVKFHGQDKKICRLAAEKEKGK